MKRSFIFSIVALASMMSIINGCGGSSVTTSEIRRATQNAVVTADCTQFQVYSQLDPAMVQSVEQGIKDKCTKEDVANIDSYLVSAKLACSNPSVFVFERTFTVSTGCSDYFKSVIAELQSRGGQASTTGAVALAEMSNLGHKAHLVAACIGLPVEISAMLQSVDDDDVSAFNNVCTRDDYDLLSASADAQLAACQAEATVANRSGVVAAYIATNPPALSSADCANLIAKTLGD